MKIITFQSLIGFTSRRVVTALSAKRIVRIAVMNIAVNSDTKNLRTRGLPLGCLKHVKGKQYILV